MGLFLLGRPRHIQYVNSIYAPRGGDCGRLWKTLPIRYFNPRPRMGGDPAFIILSLEQAISIHAPRMGGDSKNSQIMRPFLQKTYDFHKHHPAVIPDSESAVYARENYLKNLVRSYRAFLFTWTSHLKHQDILWTIRSLCSKMLNFVLITIPQVIKSKAVLLGIHNLA